MPRRPEETSRWFAETSAAILSEVAAAEKTLGNHPASNELKSTLTDARVLAALARYHSWRQLGGVNYELWKQSGHWDFYEEGMFAEHYGDPECLVEIGCWGPIVNCNIVQRGAINHMGDLPLRIVPRSKAAAIRCLFTVRNTVMSLAFAVSVSPSERATACSSVSS